jgi:hypothetical protein
LKAGYLCFVENKRTILQRVFAKVKAESPIRVSLEALLVGELLYAFSQDPFVSAGRRSQPTG